MAKYTGPRCRGAFEPWNLRTVEPQNLGTLEPCRCPLVHARSTRTREVLCRHPGSEGRELYPWPRRGAGVARSEWVRQVDDSVDGHLAARADYRANSAEWGEHHDLATRVQGEDRLRPGRGTSLHLPHRA